MAEIFKILFYIGVYLIHNVVLVSGVQQSDSVKDSDFQTGMSPSGHKHEVPMVSVSYDFS